MNKYLSLVRYPKDLAIDALSSFDEITVTEKVDGSNASFKLNKDGEIKCYSRTMELKGENGLNGFKQWVLSNVKKEDLIPNIIYFGEWLTRHKVVYPEECYNKFYLFDLYDEVRNIYINPFSVTSVINLVQQTEGMKFAPCLYAGKNQPISFLKELLSESKLREGIPEGIVIKDYDYRNIHKELVIVKWLNEEFQEFTPQKQPKVIKELTTEEDIMNVWCLSTVTQNRVDKSILKLQDDNILEPKLIIDHMKDYINLVNKYVYEDVVKEELEGFLSENKTIITEEEVLKWLGKFVSSHVPRMIKYYIGTLNKEGE